MTRLTSDDISNVPDGGSELDSRLVSVTGRTVREIALEAAGLPEGTDLSGFKVGVVPVTSGLGVIGGFAESVDAIVRRLGMQSHVTSSTDVAGFAEAVASGVDIVMMADDNQFVAYNTRTNTFTDNAYGTAMGYSVALRDAAGGLEGKDVLVVGSGFVGSDAARILKSMGASVTVTDIVGEKAMALGRDACVSASADVLGQISSHTLILNASPGEIPGRAVAEGSVISSPGVPYSFDSVALERARAIIHDPLEIGAAVMAVCAARDSIKKVSWGLSVSSTCIKA